jgi:hypothetical protein
MKRFKVFVRREWSEDGEMEVEADSEDDAREMAREELADGGDAFEWQSSNMDLQNQRVDSVEEIEEP